MEPLTAFHFLFRPLFFNFLVYGFLGGKNGSVGRKKIKNNFFSKGSILCQVVEKIYRYMEIVLTISVLQACCAVTTEYGIPSNFARKSTASLQTKISTAQHNFSNRNVIIF